MANPFPGMNPYLEDRAFWNDVHHRLITYISNALQPQIRPRYNARIEERVYVEESKREVVPDVAVLRGVSQMPSGATATALECDTPITLQVEEQLHTEGAVHIYDRDRDMRLVTVIEVLSPTNKEPRSKGWQLYRQKQEEILKTDVNLVEIDLLRGGDYVLAPPYLPLTEQIGTEWHYLVSISPADDRATFLLYPRTVREPLPKIPIPLSPDDGYAALDLGAVLAQCYEDGAYDDLIDYRKEPPPPPFSPEDRKWIESLLKSRGLR